MPKRCSAVLPPFYYQWLIAIARPLYRLKLHRQRHALPHYRQEIAERFFGACRRPVAKDGQKIVWCHAVSLGEINTAYPLLKKMLDDGHGLYITSTTQTGFCRTKVLFEREILAKQVVHGFVPIDDRQVMADFLGKLQPDLALFIETELWANCLFLLAKNAVPAVLVNARLNQKSFLRYQKFAKLSFGMMANLTHVLAQDEQSAKRFLALGLEKDKCTLVDSLKWSIGSHQLDMAQTIAKLKAQIGFDEERQWWLAGSTHDGEEQAVLAAHRQILAHFPKAVLVLVPRHPERFDVVAQLCQDSGMTTHRRSHQACVQDDTQVYLVDVMGELLAWYALADVALVAGSLVDIGGHNPVEPAIFAKPIIMGSYVQSCQVVVDDLKAVGALCQVPSGDGIDVSAIAKAVLAMFANPDQAHQKGQAGQDLAFAKQNAVQTQYAHLLAYLA